jgi:hypothetical protein
MKILVLAHIMTHYNKLVSNNKEEIIINFLELLQTDLMIKKKKKKTLKI